MENHIYRYNQKIFVVVFTVVLLGIESCSEDEYLLSTIQFEAATQALSEGSVAEVILTLDRPASRTGAVSIRIESNASLGLHYTLNNNVESNGLFTVTIPQGQKSVTFSISSINNSLFDNGKYMLLSLLSATEGLQIGSGRSSLITIDDDEGPSIANFEMVTWVVGETETDGLKVEIPFSTATKGEGSLTVELAPTKAKYGEKFFTVPEAINNSIILPVSNNTTGVSITLFIVDDELFTGDYNIDFSITGVSGVIQRGASAKLSLTVHDNERPSFASLSSGVQTIKEGDANGTTVEIAFSAPVPGTGTVSLKFYSRLTYGQDFVTIPPAYNNTITLPVALHAVAASFDVLPMENSTCGYQNLDFNITGTSGPIIGDDGATGAVVIIEDNDSFPVAFSQTDASVAENASGIDVHLTFPTPASQSATLFVAAPSYALGQEIYGTLYYTTPQAAWDYYDLYVPLTINKGDTGASFTIIPIDNDTYNPTRILVFRAGYSSNQCLNLNGEFALSILDDD